VLGGLDELKDFAIPWEEDIALFEFGFVIHMYIR
jgi:hypothetical protein